MLRRIHHGGSLKVKEYSNKIIFMYKVSVLIYSAEHYKADYVKIDLIDKKRPLTDRDNCNLLKTDV